MGFKSFWDPVTEAQWRTVAAHLSPCCPLLQRLKERSLVTPVDYDTWCIHREIVGATKHVVGKEEAANSQAHFVAFKAYQLLGALDSLPQRLSQPWIARNYSELHAAFCAAQDSEMALTALQSCLLAHQKANLPGALQGSGLMTPLTDVSMNRI